MDEQQYREQLVQRTIRYLTEPGDWPSGGHYAFTARGSYWVPDRPWEPSDDLVQEALRRMRR